MGLLVLALAQKDTLEQASISWHGDYYNLYDFWEYDPSTDIWTQKARIPGGRIMLWL
jgi:hypothetical protein